MPNLSQNIEHLSLFADTHESCLICCNNKKEDLVCRFDNCHHKICKYCDEMFYLQNIICPIENKMLESKLKENSLDAEKILLNVYHRIIMKSL